MISNTDAGKLKQYIEKIENLNAEKSEIQEQISDVFSQAKGDGFDPKIMKKVIKLKNMKTEERQTEDFLLDSYMMMLGLIPKDEEHQ